MISFSSFVLLTVGLGLAVYYLFLRKDGKKYPKGPFALPFLGNMLQMKGGPHVKLCEWAKEYGPIFQVYFGTKRTYVISDVKTAKELYSDPNMNDRPENTLIELAREGPHGVSASSGKEWSEQRRFTLRNLRDFGFGKKGSEGMIVEELNEFLANLSEQAGKPITVNRTFNVAILNIIWSMSTGKRYEQDDPKLWSVFHAFKKIGELGGRNPALLMAPALAKMFPGILGWNQVVDTINSIKSVLQGHVDEHLNSPPEDGNPRDFMDTYINEIKRTTDKDSSFYKDAGIRSLRALMADFFIAGTETVTLSLSWAVLYLSKFPEVQKKFQTELDDVVGRNRAPSLEDRPSLPYTEATITEVLRLSSIVPFGIFRVGTKDGKILGYDYTAGTQFVINLFYLHHHPELFPDPETFKPERFLSESQERGKKRVFKKPENVMAFGYGKRACLGETLARDEFFLFLTSLFHKFSISLAPESKDASLKPLPGFILAPQDYKVILTKRE